MRRRARKGATGPNTIAYSGPGAANAARRSMQTSARDAARRREAEKTLRTLDDMSADEIAKLEAEYGCEVKR